MQYRQTGSGTDVILLHGWGGDCYSFATLANSLARTHRVTAPDLYGFGRTGEPRAPMTLDDYADGVRELMNRLGIASATFICHSFGGRIGIRLAAAAPHLVDRLVLVDSAGMKPHRSIAYYARVYIHKRLKKRGKSLKGSADYRLLSPVMKATFRNIVNTFQESELSKISAPTAIFWGKRDRATPPYMARRLKRGISDSALFWLKGDHFAYVEDETFSVIVTAFLEAV